MITDQKTQNRLHADTGTALFSIRKRKEAVTRMLDILKETPEYRKFPILGCPLLDGRQQAPV